MVFNNTVQNMYLLVLTLDIISVTKNRNYDKIVSIIFLILMYSKRVDKILHNLNGQGQDGIDIISPRYRMFYIERKTPKRHFSPFGNDKHLKPDETLTLVAVVL